MVNQTRRIDTRYFTVANGTVGRSEWVRGDFDAYDSDYETIKEGWWFESESERVETSIDRIHAMVVATGSVDANGLAKFFSDSSNLGSVVAKHFTRFVDFVASFGRDDASILPRVEFDILYFVAVRNICEPPFADSREYWDIYVDLTTIALESKCFWRGSPSDLVLTISK
jgi:hypothetical protein